MLINLYSWEILYVLNVVLLFTLAQCWLEKKWCKCTHKLVVNKLDALFGPRRWTAADQLGHRAFAADVERLNFIHVKQSIRHG